MAQADAGYLIYELPMGGWLVFPADGDCADYGMDTLAEALECVRDGFGLNGSRAYEAQVLDTSDEGRVQLKSKKRQWVSITEAPSRPAGSSGSRSWRRVEAG